jgi:hypothetical protein
MKKLLVLCFALAASTVAAQSMSDITSAASAASSDDMISQLVGGQVKSLAQKFNLSEAQASQASAVVEKALKSPKLKSLLGKYSPDQLLAGSGTDLIQNALLGNKKFMKGMKGIVSEDQMGMMKEAASLIK